MRLKFQQIQNASNASKDKIDMLLEVNLKAAINIMLIIPMDLAGIPLKEMQT